MVKNIIFDVGNVLFEYDWGKPFREIGLSEEDVERIGQGMFHDEIWSKWDAGLYTLDEVRRHYISKYPEDEEAINGFMSRIGDIRVDRPAVWERIPLLKQKGYKMYLLSNYSVELFEAHTEGLEFFKYMDGGIVSYAVHYIKPQPEIYDCLLDKYKLDPAECIFFDDREENTEAAEKKGIKSVTIVSQAQLLGEIEKLLAVSKV